MSFSGDANVLGGGKRVLQANLDITSAERHRLRQIVGDSALVAGGALNQQPRLEATGVPKPRDGVVHPGGVGGRLVVAHPRVAAAASQVAQGTERHPYEKQV